MAHHITQRGVDHCPVFQTDSDRLTYLQLLRGSLAEADVKVLGWCLMTNHVHLVILPNREDSLALVLRRTHGRYAQYYNARIGRCGHLWQNRYFSCVLEPDHLWKALGYVDLNPVRAGIVETAEEYPWSSARAHRSGEDVDRLLDLEWWRGQEEARGWQELQGDEAADRELERCTYAGRPFGRPEFVEQLGDRFGRRWTRGRPKKKAEAVPAEGAVVASQGILFGQ